MTSKAKLEFPTAAETRKRHLWMEMVHWLRIELNSRFGLECRDGESVHHLEDMAATLVNSGEVYDKQIQMQLAQYEKVVVRQQAVSRRTAHACVREQPARSRHDRAGCHPAL